MKLRLVTNLRDEWPWVRVGLLEIRKKCGERWIPEDIYAQILAGNAFLYAIEDDGYLIAQRHTDPDGPVLFIWTIHGGLAKWEQHIYVELEALAQTINAKRIRMHSPRKGWERRGFFKPKSIIYEREL